MIFAERSKSPEISEWRTQFVWLDSAVVSIDERELDWRKTTPDELRRGFETLARLRPFVSGVEITTAQAARQKRNELEALKDETGARLFSDADLGVFDAYFGSTRMRIEKAGDRYSVTNGRHRLWLAQQEGVNGLPAWLTEKRTTLNYSTGDSHMANRELQDIVFEGQEQGEEADELSGKIERHKDSLQRLVDFQQEVSSLKQRLGSEKLDQAAGETDKAKAEIEQKLAEFKQSKEQLLQENQRLLETLNQENNERRRARDKAGIIESTAPPELGETVKGIIDALNEDLHQFSDTQTQLESVRQKIESLDV